MSTIAAITTADLPGPQTTGAAPDNSPPPPTLGGKPEASGNTTGHEGHHPATPHDAAEPTTSNADGDTFTASEPAEAESETSAPDNELTEEEKQQVEKLKARDQEVRRHEAAHKAAAGPYAKGGPTYTYQRGPDGRAYAVGGEVQIDTSPIKGDPAATIRKMQVIRQAATAPANPSSQDRAVAAQAARQALEAQRELHAAPTEETETTSPTDQPQDATASETNNTEGSPATHDNTTHANADTDTEPSTEHQIEQTHSIGHHLDRVA